MSKQKIVFFSIVAGVILIVAIMFMVFSKKAPSGPKGTGPAEFKVWVVGEDTAGYAPMIAGFKKAYPQFSNTNIVFTKFPNYSDYEKILLNVMIDGNAPDIFVLNNTSLTKDRDGLLESKSFPLSSSVIDIDFFEKNYNQLFSELLFQNEEKDAEGNTVKVDYIKGVPMSYQTLGVYYNFKNVRNLPSTWTKLDEELQNNAQDDYSTVGLGLGSRYVPSASDILTLMLAQDGIDSYKKLGDERSQRILNGYRSYYTDKNNKLDTFAQEMREGGLTVADLFVRGKIGMIIGYPSLMRDIRQASARAGKDSSISDRYLRTAPVFQMNDSDKKDQKVNIADYNIFVLNKTTQKSALGLAFLRYLSGKEAHELHMKNFQYTLPALNGSVDARAKQSLDDFYVRAKYEDFLRNDFTLKTFEKGLTTTFDSQINLGLDAASGSSSADLLSRTKTVVECNMRHMIFKSDYEKQCD